MCEHGCHGGQRAIGEQGDAVRLAQQREARVVDVEAPAVDEDVVPGGLVGAQRVEQCPPEVGARAGGALQTLEAGDEH